MTGRVLLLCFLLAAPAWAQRPQVQIYGHNSGTLTPIAVNADGTISVGTAGSGAIDASTLRVTIATDDEVNDGIAAIDANTDTLVASLYSDPVHGNTVEARGPHILGEAKDIDGAALPNVVTEGQAVRVAATLSGAVLTTLVHEDGLSSPIGNEDVASAAAEAGLKVFAIRDDTLDARSGTEGDFEYFHTNANGALWAIDVNSAAALTSTQLIDDMIGVEDAGETAGTGLAMAGSVRRDVAAPSAGTTGDNATLNTDALGQLWTRQLDPCSGVAKTYLPIDIVTATTTEITPSLAGSSTHYYICALALQTNAANSVAVVDDDTDGCASVTAGIYGGFGSAAEGFNFAANGGLTLGSGSGSVGRTTTANAVICIITSAATQLSGHMVVVAAP